MRLEPAPIGKGLFAHLQKGIILSRVSTKEWRVKQAFGSIAEARYQHGRRRTRVAGILFRNAI
jgi:hypothetical protein